MFKVISAEYKKTLSKPGLYVLAILLTVILILGVFIYKPTVEKNEYSTLNGTTFTAKYEDFSKELGGLKRKSDDKVTEAINSVKSYYVGDDQKETYINELYSNILSSYYEYRNCAADSSYDELITNARTKLVSDIQTFESAVSAGIAGATRNNFSVLITSKDYDTFTTFIKELKSWANVKVEKSKLAEHCKKFDKELKSDLTAVLKSLIFPTLSDTVFETYTTTAENTKLSILNTRLDSISKEIEKKLNTIQSEGTLSDTEYASLMDTLAKEYAATADTFVNLVKYELLANAFDFCSTSKQLDLKHIKDYSEYNVKSLKIKYNYLFENNKFDYNYANPLTIGNTSNTKINTYDYAYFILRLFSFVIIAYAIMQACHAIAGEVKDGTMRYIAVKPISRNEIFFGKLLAIISMSAILMIFSSIIALLVGGTVYGFETQQILTIFNSSKVLIMHPMAMLSIYLISLLIEVIIYSSIAMFVSTLLRSDLFAMTIMLLWYLINTMLPMFVQGANTWLSFYPFSHISLYPLFGSAVYAESGNFFNLLLGSKVYATTSLGLTITAIVLIITLINIVSAKLFKIKEI